MDEMNPTLVRLGMGVFAIWMVSCFSSCSELLYYFNKQEAEATVSNITEETNRHGSFIGYKVHYRFRNPENDKRERGGFMVDDPFLFSEGEKIDVEYRGNSPVFSRPKGMTNSTWVKIFLGSSAAMIALVVGMSIHSMREEQKSSRR